MAYREGKVSKNNTFYSNKGVMESQCENHIVLSRNRKNRYTYIEYKCLVHNKTHTEVDSDLYRADCKSCREYNDKQIRANNFERKISERYDGDDFELISNYKNSITKVEILHKICGKTFKVLPSAFLKAKGCPRCNNGMYDINTLKDYKVRYGSEYNSEGFDITDRKINKKLSAIEKFEVTHLICGTSYKTSHNNFYSGGRGCPACNNNNSKVHMIVHAILAVNNLKYDVEYRFDSCRNEKPLPFDFKVNISDNEFILIEVDGQQHYEETNVGHFKTSFKYIRQNDEIKNKYCCDNNIKLYRIKVGDFKTILEVFNYLKSIIEIHKIPTYKDVDKIGNSKYSGEKARKIRELYLEGYTSKQIALKFDVSSTWVKDTINYKNYKDILPELEGVIRDKIEYNKVTRKPHVLLKYKSEIIKLRNEEGLTQKQIGEMYNVTTAIVRYFLRIHNQP